ncbi:MAG: glycosyltransferase family 2 protein [Anaerolineales bacterium]
MPDPLPNGLAYPRITLVTPSFNQGRFLEETIRSILDQGYPNLEYIIIDGGSTDGSVDTIRKYAGQLAYWVSEPDRGQYHAINKGFERSTGEIMAWLNADDKHCPWALRTVAWMFASVPRLQWLCSRSQLFINPDGDMSGATFAEQYARSWFYRGTTLQNQLNYKSWIQQESTFWRRELWQAAGGRIDDSLHYAGDYELWARFFQHADLATTTLPLAAFRQHPAQKTQQIEKYYAEANQVLARYRRETIQHPLLIWLLQRVHRYLGRGTGRFGSRTVRLQYLAQKNTWQYVSRPVI